MYLKIAKLVKSTTIFLRQFFSVQFPTDERRKFKNYRQIDTLSEYVLIETETMNVECYRLNEKKKWELNVYSLEEGQENIEVNFSSVDLR